MRLYGKHEKEIEEIGGPHFPAESRKRKITAVRLCGNQGNIIGGTLSRTLPTDFPLIPSIPDELAECCLARVPWNCLVRFMTVSKTWASLIGSHKFSALRSQLGFFGRVVIVVSIPEWIGQLKVSVFDPEELAKSRRHKPLAVFNFPREVCYSWRSFRCAVIGPDLFIIGGQHIRDSITPTDWSWSAFCAHQRALFAHGRYNESLFGSLLNHLVTCKNVRRFNFVSKKWTLAAPMNFARQDFACAVIDGKIYVAGGTIRKANEMMWHPVDSAEMYDYEHDRWQLLPPLQLIRSRSFALSGGPRCFEPCMGVALEDCFYVKIVDNESANIFDTSKQEWKTIQNMWPGRNNDHPLKGYPRALACFDHSLCVMENEETSLKRYDEKLNHWKDIMPTPSTMKRIARRRKGLGLFHKGLPFFSKDQLISLFCRDLFWLGPGGRLYRGQGRQGKWISCGSVEIAHDDERLFLSTILLNSNEANQPWIQNIFTDENVWIHARSRVAIVGSGIVCI